MGDEVRTRLADDVRSQDGVQLVDRGGCLLVRVDAVSAENSRAATTDVSTRLFVRVLPHGAAQHCTHARLLHDRFEHSPFYRLPDCLR